MGLDDTAEAVSATTARMLGFALDFIAAELDVRDATTTVVARAGCGEEASVLDDGATCRFCGYAVGAEDGADEYAH